MGMSSNTWHALGTAGLAFISGYLGLRLHQERTRADAELLEAAQLRATIADMARAEQRRPNDLSATQAQNTWAPAEATPPAPPNPAAMSGTGQGRLTTSVGPITRTELAPPHRATMARMQYGKLLRELELSEEEIEDLLPMLSEITADGRSLSSLLTAAGAPRTGDEQALARFRADATAVLGAEKASQLEGMVKSFPVRAELGAARSQLEMLGEPMSEKQQNDLLAIISARSPQLPPTATPGTIVSIEAFRKWQSEKNQRFLDEAAAVLTPRQIKRLSEAQAMNEAMMQSTRSASGTSSGAAGGPAH